MSSNWRTAGPRSACTEVSQRNYSILEFCHPGRQPIHQVRPGKSLIHRSIIHAKAGQNYAGGEDDEDEEMADEDDDDDEDLGDE